MPVNTRLRCAGESHVGMVRQNNEDRVYADPDRGIFLVVDGIGGQAAGEKAAGIAIDRVRARLERQTGTLEDRVREAITMANNEILDASATNPEWHGMACVLTLAVIDDRRVVVGHVGDSRLYPDPPRQNPQGDARSFAGGRAGRQPRNLGSRGDATPAAQRSLSRCGFAAARTRRSPISSNC